MKVLNEKVENRQAVLQLEVDAADLDTSMQKAYLHFANRIFVPGFRKGRVPRPLLEQYVGKETFLIEALEHFLPEALSQIFESRGLEAIARPEVRIIQTEPVTIEVVVPLRPIVRLGDYKSIRLDPEPIEITESDVEAAIEQLRSQQGAWIPVERPVQYGDLVTMDIEGSNDGRLFLKRKNTLYEVVKGSSLPVPGFAEKIIGMQKGEENTFSLTFAATYETEALAGKNFSFKVRITQIKEKRLPELDDEFARRVGFDNIISLRQYIKNRLQAKAEETSQRQFEQKVVDAIVQICEVDYPRILLEREVDQLLNEEASHFKEGMKGLQTYLKSINKSIEEHRKELESAAKRRLVQTLVLNKIAETENIEVSESEVDDEINNLNSDNRRGEIKRALVSPEGRQSIKQLLLTRKTTERLVQIARGKV